VRVRELRAALVGVDDDMEVILRTADEPDCGEWSLIVCGVEHAGPDAGCTEREAFVLDGNTGVVQEYPNDEEDEAPAPAVIVGTVEV
jgi:hypothetical protein